MRAFASWVVVATCVACGPARVPVDTASATPSAAAQTTVDPARVDRVRSSVPTGYEFSALPVSAAPAALWGLGPGWVADPSCGPLADPGGDGAVRGWSASGPGGIVYAVVADARGGLDPAVVASCGTWTVAAGHTSGVVTVVPAPVVEGAATLGMTVDATTTVEGGIETHSHAETFVSYLDAHVAYVTVVTDPGSSAPSLGRGFAPDLLVETVAAIRGSAPAPG